MLSYLIRRVLMLVPVFLAVSVVIFLILHFIPGDPIDNLLKIGSSPEARAEMEARYGLDRPLPVQYGLWLAVVAAGLLLLVPGRVCVPLLMVVLAAQVVLLNTAPQNAYYAVSLQTWEQGRFIHFHGLAQWVGWLWPFATFAYLIGRLGGGDGGQPPGPPRLPHGAASRAAPAMPAPPTQASAPPDSAATQAPPRIGA